MNLVYVCLIIVLSVAKSLCFSVQQVVNPNHTVIVFGFSGLRWDSMERYNMPALEKLKKQGVHVHRKTDPFQTESLPAFVTMVTGQYPESHGMLSNKMKDLKTALSFEISATNTKWWKDVKPIWTHNQQSGNKSALCYWPGHHISFNGSKIDYSCSDTRYVDPFHELTSGGEITGKVMPFNQRINKVISWLNLNRTERPSFIGVYFEEPLKSIMKYGINDNRTSEAFSLVNSITQSMMDYLHRTKLCDEYNFVVTGESGAADINENIFLEEYLKPNNLELSYQIVDNGPITSIYPIRGDTGGEIQKKLFETLKNATANMTAYYGSSLPKEFHYAKEPLTMPIILVADEGYRINQGRMQVPPNKAMVGYHGKLKASQALFLARGPAYKDGYYFETLRNVDIYNLLCSGLKLTPHENSGIQDAIKHAIKKQGKWYIIIIKNVVKSPTRFTVAIIVALILLFTALYLIILSVSKATEKCRWTQGSQKKFEVFMPNKAFRKTVVRHEEGDNKHLLEDEDEEEEESETDAEGQLHFHIPQDPNRVDSQLMK